MKLRFGRFRLKIRGQIYRQVGIVGRWTERQMERLITNIEIDKWELLDRQIQKNKGWTEKCIELNVIGW